MDITEDKNLHKIFYTQIPTIIYLLFVNMIDFYHMSTRLGLFYS